MKKSAHERLELTTYMNRENYLNRFNTKEEIKEELWYVKMRLSMKLDLLTKAVLELKQIDLENKLNNKGE